MTTDCPEHGPRRYLCRVVLPVAALTVAAIGLLHAWVEADLQAHLLLQSSALSETGVVDVGSLGTNRGTDHLVFLAQEVRFRWTLLLISIGSVSAGLAGTRSLESARFPRALHPATGY
jgi:hypothetical protein